jgi:hypothetical protein
MNTAMKVSGADFGPTCALKICGCRNAMLFRAWWLIDGWVSILNGSSLRRLVRQSLTLLEVVSTT